MSKYFINLQRFADGGGDGAGAASDGAIGSEAGVAEEKGGGDSVIYGKASTDATTASEADDTSSAQTKASFDDLIKGEYKEDFEKKTQAIINKRFKETKGLQETLESHNSIISMLADKYGVEANDIESLTKAIEDDDSFYEQEAFEKGLTVKQLKEVKRLERENEQFRKAEEEAQRRQKNEQVNAMWRQQSDAFVAKYGIEDFNFANEMSNPDFARLLGNGIGVESAYIATHPDRIIGGTIAKTANTVREQMANSIASRQARPAEIGLSSNNSSQLFKSDPSKLTNDDLIEIRNRVMKRGERITW